MSEREGSRERIERTADRIYTRARESGGTMTRERAHEIARQTRIRKEAEGR